MKYVALLRGINVGGKKKVDMKKLRTIFEQLGFNNVSTYINSGNVIFEARKETNIPILEQALTEEFGFDLRLVVRNRANIEKLVQEIPEDWKNDTTEKTDVLFLWDDFDTADSLQLIKVTPVDSVRYIEGAIIWHIKKKNYAKSGLNKFIGTALYKNMTARNINTVRKIWELMNTPQ